MITILLLAILAVAIFYFYKKTGSANNNNIKEISTTSVDRVIRVYDMDKEQLKKAVDSFSDINDNEISSITPEGINQFRLTFDPSLDYIGMCYWVNFLVYSDEEKKQRYKVYGWYPFGEVQLNGEKQSFSNQTVMMYVDKDDTEYDNISFVTPDGQHYKQPFAISNNLLPLDSGSETYLSIS